MMDGRLSKDKAEGYMFGCILLHLAILVVVSLIGFSYNWPVLLHGDDGKLYYIYHYLMKTWVHFGVPVSINPLQGLAETFWYPNVHMMPSFLLASLGSGYDFHPVLLYTVVAVEIFGAMLILGYSLYIRFETILLAAWAIVLLSMPFSWPPLVYPMANYLPGILEVWVVCCLILSLYYRLGKTRLSYSVLSGIGIAALIFYVEMCIPDWFTIASPTIVIFGIAFIPMSRDARERWTKIIALAGILVFCAIGIIPFHLGTILYTDAVFFGKELFYGDVSGLGAVSIFYDTMWKLNRPVFVLALLGVLLLAFSGRKRDIRSIARVLAVVMVLLLSFAAYFFIYKSYVGPAPCRFEFYLWPFYFIFASYAVLLIIRLVFDALKGIIVRKGLLTPRRWVIQSKGHLLVLILPAVFMMKLSGNTLVNVCPWPYAPQENDMVKTLQKALRLKPGDVFRGRTATFTGFADKDTGVTWLQQTAMNVFLHREVGNDMNYLGLWNFDIPTLSMWSHHRPPVFHLMMSRFLGRSCDRHIRGVMVLTKINVDYLQSLGVRFVITDFLVNDRCLKLVQTMSIADESKRSMKKEGWRGYKPLWNKDLPIERSWGGAIANRNIPAERNWSDTFRPGARVLTLHLYELPNPNLGAYSPIRCIIATDASQTVEKMKKNFDYTRDVVVEDQISSDLVQAISSSIMFVKGGLRIKAESPGVSLLLLPVQYSHCQQVKVLESSAADMKPRIVRANLLQTGLLFKGKIDLELSSRYGPFVNQFCRINDFEDMKRLRISDVPYPSGDNCKPYEN
jgi:hypothetical protein